MVTVLAGLAINFGLYAFVAAIFGIIRALAVTASVAIAFGWHLSSADWMPIATLIAMKVSLQQSTMRGVQRLVGATLGAAIAAVFLVTVTSHHALERTSRGVLLTAAGEAFPDNARETLSAQGYRLAFRARNIPGPGIVAPCG